MTKKVHSFNQSKNVGDSGESAVQPFLNKRCYYTVDVTNQEEFYEPDIDYICIDEDLDSELIELKTDTYTARNGNIFIETWSNKEAETKGWYYECEADTLLYYAIPTSIYEFNLEELREELGEAPVEYCEEAETKEIWNQGYSSQGVTIPLDTLPERLYKEREVSQQEQENRE
jgi:hypothetical protein